MTEPDIPKWLREYAYEFELATLDRAADEIDHLRSEIDRLARYILASGFDEPSRSEGAVDVAIRLLRDAEQTRLERDLWRKLAEARDGILLAYRVHGRTPGKHIDAALDAEEQLRQFR